METTLHINIILLGKVRNYCFMSGGSIVICMICWLNDILLSINIYVHISLFLYP